MLCAQWVSVCAQLQAVVDASVLAWRSRSSSLRASASEPKRSPRSPLALRPVARNPAPAATAATPIETRTSLRLRADRGCSMLSSAGSGLTLRQEVIDEVLAVALPAARFIDGLCRRVPDVGVERDANGAERARMVGRGTQQPRADARSSLARHDEQIVQDERARQRNG